MKRQIQAHPVSFEKTTLVLFLLLCEMTYFIELRREIAGRLKEARENNGFDTIESFCKENQLPYSEYLSYEMGIKPIKISQAKIYAQLLNVSVQWLIIGK